MCGRFLLEPRTPQAVRQFFDLAEESELEPRWNLAPTQSAWVVRRPDGARRSLARMRWGLIPAWAKDAAVGSKMINARAETAAEKPSFRSAWQSRRCVVPATGWYEWRVEQGRKQPWLLRLADSAFTPFAGLWERWQPAGQAAVESFTILTTAAVPELAPWHQRMPVVLRREWIPAWLAGGGPADLPTPAQWSAQPWQQQRVSARVNSPRHDDAACAEPRSDSA